MRYVIKIGSALISSSSSGIDSRWLKSKVSQIAELHGQGHEVVLVSSGAVAAGMEEEGVAARPTETLSLQLLSGIGQIRLMKYYRDYFGQHGVRVAQVLLTHHNFASRVERETVGTIMNAYLEKRIIPVVNENDMVNKEEVEFQPIFSDNDILAALVAIRLNVDLLVILTDVDGLYRGNPKRDAKAELIEEVSLIDGAVERMASQDTNSLGLGGMLSKVRAARMATGQGIETIVAGGRHSLADILASRVKRTVFRGGASSM